MIAAPDDATDAEAERHDWLAGLDSFEKQLVLGYFTAYPEAFDQARAYVERIRAGATA